jgi:hypothetical protein
MYLRSMFVLSALWLAVTGCSKGQDKTPYAEAETSYGSEGPAQKTGEELDNATDNASDEVQHLDNDRDEAMDEANDTIDEATGAD